MRFIKKKLNFFLSLIYKFFINLLKLFILFNKGFSL